MKALLLIFVITLLCSGVGDWVIRPFRTLLNEAERFLFATVVGIGITGYGLFALGMLGGYQFAGITSLWFVALVIGGYPLFRFAKVFYASMKTMPSNLSTLSANSSLSPIRIASILIGILLLGFGVLAIATCYIPLNANAWDSLSYHLAAPKIYLQTGRFSLLPTQHHSNFPFLMEMHFGVGLLYEGTALANLFHLITGVLLVLAVYLFCNRYLCSSAGLIACLLLVTTPVVLWEASIAYIDIALGLFIFCAFFFASLLLEKGSNHASRTTTLLSLLIGVFMGLALGQKYLSLVPLTLLGGLLLLRKVPFKHLALYGIVAIAIGSPWYIKNAVWLNNPVYPFAFNVFKDTRYWSEDRAIPYADEQKSFGTPHELSKPVESLTNLARTPWLLSSTPNIYTNPANYTFTSLVGGLFAPFLFSLFIFRKHSSVIQNVGLFLCVQLAAWFFVSQHIRYLIPFVPYAAILGGYAFVRWCEASRLLKGAAVALVALHTFMVTLCLYALPTAGRAAQDALFRGLQPTALSIPEVIETLTSKESKDRFQRRIASFNAIEWFNANSEAKEGIILFDEVHGYFLNRRYLWGDQGHSAYIPYETMKSSAALSEFLLSKDIQYVLINLNFCPANPRTSPIPNDAGVIDLLIPAWYADKNPPNTWRRFIGEEVRRGKWRTQFVDRGVVVLKIESN